uniref:hypothetical protein n=1 Tax=Paractinoplanes polyasparticus TaxID=2856853 RepID=UPI0027E1E8D1|nr:hypothetical protein [Actinoplanes polyasparticus]
MQAFGAGEEDLALVGEVAEERALGEAGTFGDLGHRRLVEASLGVQVHGRLAEAGLRVRLPATHAPIVGEDSS